LDTTKREIAATQAVAAAQLVGPMRQAWISELRTLMTELFSAALHDHVAGFEDRTDDEYRRLGELEQRLEFMLNPAEQMHKDLLGHVRLMVQALGDNPGAENDQQFSGLHTLGRQTGRTILKIEWNRIKTGVA
jgi:hypothetical protein